MLRRFRVDRITAFPRRCCRLVDQLFKDWEMQSLKTFAAIRNVPRLARPTYNHCTAPRMMPIMTCKC